METELKNLRAFSQDENQDKLVVYEVRPLFSPMAFSEGENFRSGRIHADRRSEREVLRSRSSSGRLSVSIVVHSSPRQFSHRHDRRFPRSSPPARSWTRV